MTVLDFVKMLSVGVVSSLVVYALFELGVWFFITRKK